MIAVSDILTSDLSQKEKKQLFNALESGLLDLRQYEVTSRQDVDKILDEQKFQKSGCTDQQCAAEIGKLLNADLMLLSEVTYDIKSGEIDLYLKLVDVETAKISTSINKYETLKKFRDILSKIPDYLLELYRKDNVEIGRQIPTGPSQKEQGIGQLEINSDPIGVKVLVDNRDEGFSPAIIKLSGGKHRVVLTYEGYELFARSINVIVDSTVSINAEMVKLTGDLMIVSTPKDADVFINDEWRGKSPLELKYMDIGDYFIRITADGYTSFDTKFTVQYKKPNVLNKKLVSKPASILFFSVPPGAKVLIDGKNKGLTSLSGLFLEVPAGKHTVSMKLQGYSKEDKEINLKAGEITDMELVLSKLPQGTSENKYAGWVSVKGSPTKATLSIFQGRSNFSLKGNKKLSTPLSYHELYKGKYGLKIKQDGYKSTYIPFQIIAQKLINIDYKLTVVDKNKARWRSIICPGLGHFYAENNLRGYFWMGLESMSLVATYVMYSEMLNKTKKYENAKTAYYAAEYEGDILSKGTAMEEALKIKNTYVAGLAGAGAVAITIWVWNIFDAVSSIPTVFDSNIELSLNSNGQVEAKFVF